IDIFLHFQMVERDGRRPRCIVALFLRHGSASFALVVFAYHPYRAEWRYRRRIAFSSGVLLLRYRRVPRARACIGNGAGTRSMPQTQQARPCRNAMPTAAEFRSFAEACTKMATTSKADTNKAGLLTMAEKWAGLAEHADRMRRLVRDADAVLDGANPPS